MILFCILCACCETHGSETFNINPQSPRVFLVVERIADNAKDFAIHDLHTKEKVGFISASFYEDQKAQINRLEIEESHRRQGYGFQSLKTLLSTLKEESKVVRLIVWKDNPAIRLYEKVGFKKDGEKDLIEGYLWMSKDMLERETL